MARHVPERAGEFGDDHGITGRRIKSGETFTYYFGSCWSKGEIQSWSDWLMMVDNLSY